MKAFRYVLLAALLCFGLTACELAPVPPTDPLPSLSTEPSQSSGSTQPDISLPEKTSAFYFANGPEYNQLYRMDPDGTVLEPVVSKSCRDVRTTGEYVYFLCRAELYAHHIPTGALIQAARNVSMYCAQGSKLVYSVAEEGFLNYEIHLMDLTQNTDTLLMTLEMPEFVLDRGLLYYASYTGRGQALEVLDLSTGAGRVLMDDTDHASYLQLQARDGGVWCLRVTDREQQWIFVPGSGAPVRVPGYTLPTCATLVSASMEGALMIQWDAPLGGCALKYYDASGEKTLLALDEGSLTAASLEDRGWLITHTLGKITHYLLTPGLELIPLNTAGPLSSMFAQGDFPVLDSSTARIPVTSALYHLFVEAPGHSGPQPLCSTTHGAWLNIADRKADLAFLAAPTPEEQAYLAEKGVEVERKLYGGDGLVFIGNGANPVTNLSREQLLDIYRGRITNWRQLGGPDMPITVYYRDDQSGSQRLFEKLLFAGEAIPDFAGLGFPVLHTMSTLVDTVLADPYAIGYSIMTYLEEVYARQELKVFSVDGVLPSPETVKDQSYPFHTQGYLVIRKDEPADSPARRLFDWFGCPVSDQLLKQSNVTPLHE